MRLFGLFKPSPKTIATVRIAFPHDFESSSVVSLLVEGRLPAGMEIWIWDLYYAKTLFNLTRCQAAEGLKAQLEAFAQERVAVMASGLPVSPELTVLDPDLVLSSTPTAHAETYRVEVTRGKDWPLIQTHLPTQGFQNRAAYSVLAFAQYLINRDRTMFAREFPVHVLAMRQYYLEVQPYDQLRSVLGAPIHAIKSATSFFKDLTK